MNLDEEKIGKTKKVKLDKETKRRLIDKYMIEAAEEKIKDQLIKVLKLKMEEEELLGEVLAKIKDEDFEKLVEYRMDDEEKWNFQFYWGFLNYLLKKKSPDGIKD